MRNIIVCNYIFEQNIIPVLTLMLIKQEFSDKSTKTLLR